jgi:putative tryptophan/tyrosine transport system substrate-binding protein
VRRREFIAQLLAAVASPPATAFAQEPGRIYRVGILVNGANGSLSPPLKAFIDGLGRLGFVEGKNLSIDRQSSVSRADQQPAYARELAAAGVDVILASSGDLSIRAAQDATRTIPILGVADDMVGSGFVQSLAKPGGNITGVSILSTELDQKRQELLLELVPGARRIGALLDAKIERPGQIETQIEAAQARGVAIEVFRVGRPEEIVPAIERAKDAGCAALNVLASPLFYLARHYGMLERCAALGLPAIYHLPEIAEAGGLIAYGPRITSVFGDQLPRLFQKLVQGVKPADIPVERPIRVELVINLKAAKALALTVSQTLLAQATDFVE